jgi:hypothetical protein
VARLRLVAAGGLIALSCVSMFASCVTNHDSLAKKPGSEKDAGKPDSSLPNYGGAPGVDTEDAGDGISRLEPDGPDRLTLVNGLVDVESLALCLREVENGEPGAWLGAPLVLEYAKSETIDDLESLEIADRDVQPVAFMGEAAELEGQKCKDLWSDYPPLGPTIPGSGGTGGVSPRGGAAGADGLGGAGGSSTGGAAPVGAGGADDASGGEGGQPNPKLPVTTRELPVLPAGTFASGRHRVLVISGCADATLGEPNCGPPGLFGTTELVMVSPSRKSQTDRVGLYAVHASRATGKVDFEIAPDQATGGKEIGDNVTFGVLTPRDANLKYALSEFGAIKTSGIRILGRSDQPLFVRWSTLKSRSGLDLIEGRTYSLVFVGPDVDSAGTDGNLSAIVLVDVPLE